MKMKTLKVFRRNSNSILSILACPISQSLLHFLLNLRQSCRRHRRQLSTLRTLTLTSRRSLHGRDNHRISDVHAAAAVLETSLQVRLRGVRARQREVATPCGLNRSSPLDKHQLPRAKARESADSDPEFKRLNANSKLARALFGRLRTSHAEGNYNTAFPFAVQETVDEDEETPQQDNMMLRVETWDAKLAEHEKGLVYSTVLQEAAQRRRGPVSAATVCGKGAAAQGGRGGRDCRSS